MQELIIWKFVKQRDFNAFMDTRRFKYCKRIFLLEKEIHI